MFLRPFLDYFFMFLPTVKHQNKCFTKKRGFPRFGGPKWGRFGGHFWYLLDTISNAFSGTLLEGTFCKIWCQKHPKWEAFGGHFEDIFDDRLFLDFCYPYCTKPWFLRSGGHPNCIIFGDFFEAALREASGTRFFRILSDFGLQMGGHLAPKRHQKMRPQKVSKSGAAGSPGNRLWAL